MYINAFAISVMLQFTQHAFYNIVFNSITYGLGVSPTPLKNSGYTTVSLCVQKIDMCCQPEKNTDMLCI